MNKRGSIPLFVAATMPIALVAGVFAIDAGRYWLAQARLQTALDAAALVAARDLGSANMEANAKAVLAANFNGGSPGKNDTAWNDISVVATGDSVSVNASVTVDPLMNRIVGIGGGTLGVRVGKPLLDPRKFARAASAIRTTKGMELALVIDVTLSMVEEDGTVAGENRVESASNAAKELLKILYGDTTLANGSPNPANKKWLEDLFISVVPFNVTVNYGKNNFHFIGGTPPASAYPNSWTGPTSWGGCVEMRSRSAGDANTQNSANALARFYWPSTYDPSLKHNPNLSSGTTQPYCLSAAAYKDTRGTAYTSGAHNVCMGHNDWTAPAAVMAGVAATTGANAQPKVNSKQNTLISVMASNSSIQAAGVNAWATAHGPNMMCPPDSGDRLNNLTVLPLTRDRATVEARLNALTKLPFSWGTNIASGLQAGWFTLSPNWKNNGTGWPGQEPPDDSNDPRPVLKSLPLPYYTQNMQKVMVLLTDGDNTWHSARSFQGTNDNTVRPESRKVEAFYTSYGYLAKDNRLGATIPTVSSSASSSTIRTAIDNATASAEGKVDAEVAAWCTAIKQKVNATDPEKITLYVIGLGKGISSSTATLLSNCASLDKDGKTRLYYPAPTADKLKDIFKTIGTNLARLRLNS